MFQSIIRNPAIITIKNVQQILSKVQFELNIARNFLTLSTEILRNKPSSAHKFVIEKPSSFPFEDESIIAYSNFFLLSLLKMNNSDTKYIVDLLKQGDKKTLERIYVENREGFINFSKKYNVEEYDAVDIYQDSIIALRENAINGKIDNLQSNISTYLFAIGKYKIYHNFRIKTKTELTEDFDLVEENLDFGVNLYKNVLTNEQRLLKKSFDELGDRCKSVLNLFYYQGYNLDEIKEILNYSNKKVLKSQKSRCIKQLKNLIHKNYDKS